MPRGDPHPHVAETPRAGYPLLPMRTQTLGTSELSVTRLAYGCMRISGSWDRTKVDAEVIRRGIAILEAAVDAGYTFFDHADIYGDTACESIFGAALRQHPDWRDRLVVATKCGICFEDEPDPGDPHRYDFSREHILRSVDGSLERLGVERIDLLMLHRPDFLADPDEIASAFDDLKQSGKVREFGVSNFRPSLVSALESALPFPLQVNQVEIHPRRLDCFTDGTLDQCLERGITPMAWSPVARGPGALGMRWHAKCFSPASAAAPSTVPHAGQAHDRTPRNPRAPPHAVSRGGRAPARAVRDRACRRGGARGAPHPVPRERADDPRAVAPARGRLGVPRPQRLGAARSALGPAGPAPQRPPLSRSRRARP